MATYADPPQVAQALSTLGAHVRVARLRRGWSVAQLAEKAGVNRNTLSALEQGKPGTAMRVCVAVLWALGLERALDAVAAPDTDLHGKALEAARRPLRAGRISAERERNDF